MKKVTFLIAVFCILGKTMVGQKQTTVQKTLQNGIIEGFSNSETGLNYFFGIPFAQPPVDDLRWKAPQPVKNWSGVKETKEFGPAPVQANVFGDMDSRSPKQSEDCLYLNVWAPAGEDLKDLPVLVYFYGGGFVAGDASEPRYDGEAMAKRGVVVVTTNYRLNIFGFFAHPELSEEAPYNSSGNYGLLDQNAALQWVQNNIEAFGGDPEKVTIAGESAGSISVSAQMASPLSRDLIAGAIGESGAAIHPTLAPVSLEEAEKTGVEFAQSIGHDSLEALRNLSTDEIFELYKQSGRFGFPGVVDGYFLPKTLPEIFRAGEQAQVPLLVGWNSAEIPGMAFTQGPYSSENYTNKVKEAYPEDSELVLTLYPPGTERETEISATALASDRFIVYSTWKWFDLHRKNSDASVYRYLYDKVRPPMKDENLAPGLAGGTVKKDAAAPPAPEPVGAPHAAEIEYFLGNLSRNENFAWTKDDYLVSETIQRYLANFIKTGNPNEEGLPQWPSAKAAEKNPPVLIMDVETRVENAKNEERYLFLDKSYGNDK